MDITELAARIASNTAKVNKYYLDKNLALPSFDHNGPTKSLIRPDDADIEAARQAVIFDCSELRILMQGPSEYLAGLGFYVSWQSCGMLVGSDQGNHLSGTQGSQEMSM